MATRGRPQDFRTIVDERFADVWQRIHKLERPDGSQLSQTMPDLQERVSHVQTGSFGVSLPLSTSPALTSAVTPTLEFTLHTKRRVLVTLTTNYRYAKTSGGLSTGSVLVNAVVSGPGINAPFSGASGVGSAATQSRSGGTLVATGTLVLEPGDYAAQGVCEIHIGDAVSAPGGSVSFNDPYLLQVQVLERLF